MCKEDTYIFRVSNVPLSTDGNLATLNANKDEFTVKVPELLRKKGKCKVKVANFNIQQKNATGTSVFPSNTHTAVIAWDLPVLGYANENDGLPFVCASGHIDTNKNNVFDDAPSPSEFTCVELPPQITFSRKCYKSTSPFSLVSADNFTTDVVPMFLQLELRFYEDMKE